MSWDIKDKTVLITGATSGIGEATMFALLEKGARVIFTARNIEKARRVLEEAKAKTKNENVKFYEVNLESLSSIRNFVDEFKKNEKNLHVLINNAGTWENSFRETPDGFEVTFEVNYLAPFYLTNLLLDLLIENAPSRIVNVSSAMHLSGSVDFLDLELRKHYNGIKSYSNSKLYLLIFTKELARRLKDKNVSAFAVHPGLVRTEIFRNLPAFVRNAFLIGARTKEKGAETSIYLATEDGVSQFSGGYFADKKPQPYKKVADSLEIAQKLWEITVEYIRKVDPNFKPYI